MPGIVPTPLHDALTELELAAGLVLLADQEAQPTGDALDRLRRALATVHESRGLADELRRDTGRPVLHVLAGMPLAQVGAA